ncbi:ArsR/SmtB family transcription factor [Methylocella tundrae]|uniref:ArsR/SmtB family transcription factor n=1 Tax=Methylocella tundrae TaxID=227605 RepID=UPI001AED4753|nr:metalloregulator ArsR/SmtB family transcription factor [Methylocella tundrae]
MSGRHSVDHTLAALADPIRRQTVELLGRRSRRAGELASALGLPAPAMSRHLRALKQCGLVEEKFSECDARVRIYALRDGAMTDLKNWVAATEQLWSDQLGALKEHVGKRRE